MGKVVNMNRWKMDKSIARLDGIVDDIKDRSPTADRIKEASAQMLAIIEKNKEKKRHLEEQRKKDNEWVAMDSNLDRRK